MRPLGIPIIKDRIFQNVVKNKHQILLEKYGGGRDFPKIINYFESRQVNPNSQDGYELMRRAFKEFKYQSV